VKVKRIVPNVTAANPADAAEFYESIFELKLVMDNDWIRTYASDATTTAQISIASQGGSGTPVPDLSIEVDDLETAIQRIEAADVEIEYGPVDEPWGVRRLYVRDPFGMLINVLQHT
jgi:catechol 2,3-dioxygenase-like lactoylglutathione lyase family enzyme